MKEFFHSYRHFAIVIFLPVYLICFFLMENIVGPETSYFVCYWPLIDDAIPFCEWFVLPYIAWYPMMAAVLLYIGLHRESSAEFIRAFVFIFGGMFLCLVIYLIFPNGQPLRPDVFPRQNFLTELIGGLYAADTNTNVLPSMHVLASMATYSAAVKSRYPFFKKGAARIFLFILCLLICASTVLIKQHSILDAIAAVVLYVPLHLFVFGPFTRFLEKKFPSDDV